MVNVRRTGGRVGEGVGATGLSGSVYATTGVGAGRVKLAPALGLRGNDGGRPGSVLVSG